MKKVNDKKQPRAEEDIPRVYKALPVWFKEGIWKVMPEKDRLENGTLDLAYQIAAIIGFSTWIKNQLDSRIKKFDDENLD